MILKLEDCISIIFSSISFAPGPSFTDVENSEMLVCGHKLIVGNKAYCGQNINLPQIPECIIFTELEKYCNLG